MQRAPPRSFAAPLPRLFPTQIVRDWASRRSLLAVRGERFHHPYPPEEKCLVSKVSLQNGKSAVCPLLYCLGVKSEPGAADENNRNVKKKKTQSKPGHTWCRGGRGGLATLAHMALCSCALLRTSSGWEIKSSKLPPAAFSHFTTLPAWKTDCCRRLATLSIEAAVITLIVLISTLLIRRVISASFTTKAKCSHRRKKKTLQVRKLTFFISVALKYEAQRLC